MIIMFKNRKIFISIFAVLLSLTTIAMFLIKFNLQSKQTNLLIQSDNIKNITIELNDKENTFVIIQNAKENKSKLNSTKDFLRQNNFTILDVKLTQNIDADELENNLKPIYDKYGLDGNIYFISYGDIAENLINSNFEKNQGMILFSPVVENVELIKATKPTILITTSSDENATPKNVTKLYNKLADDNINATGFAFNAEKNNATVAVISQTYSSYKPYSKEVINSLKNWINNKFQLNTSYKDNQIMMVILIYGSVIGLAGLMFSVNWHSVTKQMEQSYKILNLQVISPTTFLIIREIVWLISLPLLAVLAWIMWYVKILEFNSGTVVALYFFGSGVVMYFLYHKGKMPGVDGKLDTKKILPTAKSVLKYAVAIIALSIIVLISIVTTGYIGVNLNMNSTIAGVIYTILLMPGFYIYAYENVMLNDISAGKVAKMLYRVSLFLPLIIIALICIPIGYVTWMYTSYINIVVLIVILSLGKALSQITENVLFTAMSESIIYAILLAIVQIA